MGISGMVVGGDRRFGVFKITIIVVLALGWVWC